MTDSESTQLVEIIPHVKVLIDPDQESSLIPLVPRGTSSCCSRPIWRNSATLGLNVRSKHPGDSKGSNYPGREPLGIYPPMASGIKRRLCDI